MDPRHLFIDERLTGRCVYCGGQPDTRDHCPSKVLLDEPFPANLGVVEACAECNDSFSSHEQYLACLIEAVICESAEPDDVNRINIKRILAADSGSGLSIIISRPTAGACSWIEA